MIGGSKAADKMIQHHPFPHQLKLFCTSLKLLFVPTENASVFAKKFVGKINALRVGLLWQINGGVSDYATSKSCCVKYMLERCHIKGSKVLIEMGVSLIGGKQSTLMVPAV